MPDRREAKVDQQIQNNLAELRSKRGVASATLAQLVGVNRQTIYAIEAGQYMPNTAVTLRLAAALGVAVEELFHLRTCRTPKPDQQDMAIVGTREKLHPGQPVQWCRVGKRTVGVPATPMPSYLAPAHGFVSKPASRGRVKTTVRLADGSAAAERLLLAGCDPAMSVLARHLRQSDIELLLAPVNSSEALTLLRDGLVHIAGTHLREEATQEDNLPAIRALFPRKGAVAVVTFAEWEEGLVTAAGNPQHIKTVEDLARPKIRMINRELGAGSRRLLDVRLKANGIASAKVNGYGQICFGHLAAAGRVATGQADCCVSTRSAARAFGLGFIPLVRERYDLVVRREHWGSTGLTRLLDTLSEGGFRRELEAQGGYDTRQTGQRVA
ncbi:MAG: helix-turn-helix domain-containing protein [Acidobacteriota bacterium]|nr:helix-turn-helix domain-containing protein [Acidobacteriota bacterium]